MECLLCQPGEGSVYIGETSRNLYTRGREHLDKYRSTKRNKDSFIKKHQDEKHYGCEAEFRAKVTGTFSDCLSRQVSEGVHIRRSDKNILNSKSEWHQPALWRVQSEIMRDWQNVFFWNIGLSECGFRCGKIPKIYKHLKNKLWLCGWANYIKTNN